MKHYLNIIFIMAMITTQTVSAGMLDRLKSYPYPVLLHAREHQMAYSGGMLSVATALVATLDYKYSEEKSLKEWAKGHFTDTTLSTRKSKKSKCTGWLLRTLVAIDIAGGAYVGLKPFPREKRPLNTQSAIKANKEEELYSQTSTPRNINDNDNLESDSEVDATDQNYPLGARPKSIGDMLEWALGNTSPEFSDAQTTAEAVEAVHKRRGSYPETIDTLSSEDEEDLPQDGSPELRVSTKSDTDESGDSLSWSGKRDTRSLWSSDEDSQLP